ncbi:hypothetical protein [Acetobacter vaccinii]|uniref:Lipocalin-like domain-containing protein n=1 Tax=Acetobacter vaccinii TaxID=2592655 RepID=A0A5C1YPD2_9PROT|nr:hypothetical protein [Acetobacter vaccinii]QEO17120.1 hypothetical protein FLP30_04690 [Acetobacter vaccinii]
MTRLPLLLLSAGLVASPALAASGAADKAAAPATKAAAPAQAGHYTMAAFMGKWSVMANIDPVMVAGNRAMGPAARLLVTLPDTYAKVVGQAHFSLAKVNDTTWAGTQDTLKISMSLVSQNSAQIVVVRKDGHTLELPLYRDDDEPAATP